MIVAGKTILDVISMALLWQESGIGMTLMAHIEEFLTTRMATEEVRVTSFFFLHD